MTHPTNEDVLRQYREWLSARVEDLKERSQHGANLLPLLEGEARACLNKLDALTALEQSK